MRSNSAANANTILRATVAATIATAVLGAAGPAAALPQLPDTGSPGSGSSDGGSTRPGGRKVVVIGLDGTMYSKVVEAKAPNLLKLAEQGTLGQSSIAPHTTISGPSWATVLTGVGYQARHQEQQL
ncbi:alkaline phosphatase family protein [Nocardia arthritidis]|uniref:Nucleotide pyrophosphatase n=1 Tax=Nocardia arthritidis TaxID=228602 RepID=A0A6G9YE43_9NOCA|nr:alkaline phosphatase family protein [Nocardia arthritidis]QIS11499.1 hypothetical protein F5544_18125 [Nocardia arthritidis]